MTNPSAINRPTPTPRSITTLVTALRQSQPSRTSSQARTPSPVTLGRTWAKNTPMAVTAIMAARVMRSSSTASASTTLRQRSATSGICSSDHQNGECSPAKIQQRNGGQDLAQIDLARDVPKACAGHEQLGREDRDFFELAAARRGSPYQDRWPRWHSFNLVSEAVEPRRSRAAASGDARCRQPRHKALLRSAW